MGVRLDKLPRILLIPAFGLALGYGITESLPTLLFSSPISSIVKGSTKNHTIEISPLYLVKDGGNKIISNYFNGLKRSLWDVQIRKNNLATLSSQALEPAIQWSLKRKLRVVKRVARRKPISRRTRKISQYPDLKIKAFSIQIPERKLAHHDEKKERVESGELFDFPNTLATLESLRPTREELVSIQKTFQQSSNRGTLLAGLEDLQQQFHETEMRRGTERGLYLAEQTLPVHALDQAVETDFSINPKNSAAIQGYQVNQSPMVIRDPKTGEKIYFTQSGQARRLKTGEKAEATFQAQLVLSPSYLSELREGRSHYEFYLFQKKPKNLEELDHGSLLAFQKDDWKSLYEKEKGRVELTVDLSEDNQRVHAHSPYYVYGKRCRNQSCTWYDVKEYPFNPVQLQDGQFVPLNLTTLEKLVSTPNWKWEGRSLERNPRVSASGVLRDTRTWRPIKGEVVNYEFGASAVFDLNQQFQFKDIAQGSQFRVEVKKAGFEPIFTNLLGISKPQEIPLLTPEHLQEWYRMSGLEQNFSEATIVGVSSPGSSIAYSGSGVVKYLTREFKVNPKLKLVDDSRLFVILNAESGLRFIYPSFENKVLPPHPLYTEKDTLNFMKIGESQKRKIEGKVVNFSSASGTTVNGASIRLLGYPESVYTKTDKNGEFRIENIEASSEAPVLVEVFKEGFYRHVYKLSFLNGNQNPSTVTNFSIKPRSLLDGLALEAEEYLSDPALGVVEGDLGENSGLKVELVPVSRNQLPVEAYYFEEDGTLNTGKSMADKKRGRFIFFNASAGESELVVKNARGDVIWNEPVHVIPSSVSVIKPLQYSN